MNVLMLSDVYFPRVNGVSTSIRTFRRELHRLGHEVCLLAPAYGPDDPVEPDLLRLPARGVVVDPEDRMLRTGPVWARLPELRARRFDLVHIQTPFVAHWLGVRLARALGVPTLETYHTFFEEYLFHYVPALPRAWLRAAARALSRRQCNALDGLVVPSQAMLDVLRGYGVRTPGRIIPTGLDRAAPTHGDGAAFRAAHGIDPRRPLLVHVGRVAHEKNIDFLLHMLATLRRSHPQVLLVIAGEGPAAAHLRRLGERLELGAHLLFVGYLERERALPDCYCAGDAFVFASRTETQGLVLLEAMSLGVPVVSTAVMGTRDIVGPGIGALVAREDAADFAAKVARVLDDPALRARLGAAARTHARRWRADATAAALAGFYAALAAGTADATVPDTQEAGG